MIKISKFNEDNKSGHVRGKVIQRRYHHINNIC